jgi:predicted nucleic acid-binding protein
MEAPVVRTQIQLTEQQAKKVKKITAHRGEFVTSGMHRLGIAALLTAARRNLSLVDCVSLEVMRDPGIKSVFAFDDHFRQYGFSPFS